MRMRLSQSSDSRCVASWAAVKKLIKKKTIVQWLKVTNCDNGPKYPSLHAIMAALLSIQLIKKGHEDCAPRLPSIIREIYY